MNRVGILPFLTPAPNGRAAGAAAARQRASAARGVGTYILTERDPLEATTVGLLHCVCSHCTTVDRDWEAGWRSQ